MAKKGDKFVIEVDDVFKSQDGNTLYKIKGFNSLVFDRNGIGKLRAYDNSITENASYLNYLKGLNEAWEACRKIECEIPISVLNEIFKSDLPGDIYDNFTPNQAVSIIKRYEEEIERRESERQFDIGDVVIHKKTGKKGVIFKITECDDEIDNWQKRISVHIVTPSDVYIISSVDKFIEEDIAKNFEKTGEKQDDFISMMNILIEKLN